LSRVIVRIMGVGIVCAVGLCMYFLSVTLRLQTALVRLKGQRSLTAASRIAEERKLAEQGLQKKYTFQLASFAKLAHDLQIEKNKAKKLEGFVHHEVKKP